MINRVPASDLPRLLQNDADASSLQAQLWIDSVHCSEECRLRNDRQSYLQVVRQLVKAQFVLEDRQLTLRLWQDVSERKMDLGRIVHLLYGCSFHDVESMLIADEQYLALVDEEEDGRS